VKRKRPSEKGRRKLFGGVGKRGAFRLTKDKEKIYSNNLGEKPGNMA